MVPAEDNFEVPAFRVGGPDGQGGAVTEVSGFDAVGEDHRIAVTVKTYLVADAVFLIDNQRYVKKDAPAENNLNAINARVAEPFYNVLCAGEETNRRFVGSKTLDAGDIIQTLAGWTVIGGGTSELERRLPFCGPKRDFRDKMFDTSRAVHAIRADDDLIAAASLENNTTVRTASVTTMIYFLYIFQSPCRPSVDDIPKLF